MSIGRVTQGMLTGGSLDNLQRGLGRLAKVQEHLSTGRVLDRPPDNPTGTTTPMRRRRSLADQTQYAPTAQDGLGWLTQIDTALGSVTHPVRQARDLAIAGATSGAMGSAARTALAIEVEGLREEVLAQANVTYSSARSSAESPPAARPTTAQAPSSLRRGTPTAGSPTASWSR